MMNTVSMLWNPRNEKSFSEDEENKSHTLQGPFHNSSHLTLSPLIFKGACSIRHNNGGRWWPRLFIAEIPTFHFFHWLQPWSSQLTLFPTEGSNLEYFPMFPTSLKVFSGQVQLFQMVALLRKRSHRYKGIMYKTNFKSLKIGYFGFKYIYFSLF